MNATNKDPEAVRKRVKRFGKIGGSIAGGGGAVIVLFPIILNFILDLMMVYERDGLVVKVMEEVPIPLHCKLYFFNLENPNEFLEGAKPRFREMGPYTWNLWLKREFTNWGPNDEYVEFYNRFGFVFNPDKTVGDLSDPLTILNPVTYGGAGLTANILAKIPFSFTVAPIVYGFMKTWFYAHGEGNLKVTTIGDLVEGKEMGMLGTVEILIKPLKWLGFDKIEIVSTAIKLFEAHARENKFGFLWAVNNSRLGPQEVWTGKSDWRKFDRLYTFRGDRSLSHWNDPKCNAINGTEGTTFGKTFIDKEDVFRIFLGEACRGLYATYDRYTFDGGFPSWRYSMPPEMFASPDKNPDNKCFCQTPNDYSRCDGIFDIGPCLLGAPAAVSYPHLLYASEKLQSQVEGFNPDPDKHQAYFDVNPIVGAPVSLHIRIQANLLVKPVPLMIGFGDLPEAVYPLVWAEVGFAAEGILAVLMAIGMNIVWIMDLGPYIAFWTGTGVLGYTSYLAIKDRDIVFNRNTIMSSTIARRMDAFMTVDRQMDTKARQLYPNLYETNTNGQPLRPNPALNTNNNNSNTQSKRRESVRISSPINGVTVDPNQTRVNMSPPGATQ